MTMKPKTQRQEEKQQEKKKLSQALRKNLMRRKVIETDVRDNKKDHNK